MSSFDTYPDRVPAALDGVAADAPGEPDSPLPQATGGASTRPAEYARDRSRIAVRGPVPPALAGRDPVVIEEADLTVVSVRPDPDTTLPEERLAPVYTLGAGGAPFVPTGHVSVRFRQGVDARSMADALRDAGYRIVEVPGYAPHFAWLESVSGDDAAALAGLSRVAGLPDVTRVEPQMISPRALR